MQPTLVDWLRYRGGTGVALMPMLVHSVAMAAVGPAHDLFVLARRRRRRDTVEVATPASRGRGKGKRLVTLPRKERRFHRTRVVSDGVISKRETQLKGLFDRS